MSDPKNRFSFEPRTNNAFRKNNNYFQANKTLSEEEKNWGKKKFNPLAKLNQRVHAESGTPWFRFKNEINEKKMEEQNANTVDMNSAEAKQFLKQREQNYRKNRMLEKKHEPTIWENFSEKPEKEKHLKSKKHINKNKKHNSEDDKKKKLVENFSTNTLSTGQKNLIRRAITKAQMSSKGTLRNAIGALERRAEIREKRKNIKNAN